MSEHDPIEEIRRTLSVERVVRSAASDWTGNQGGDRVGRCTHPEHGHTSSNSNGTPNMIVTEDDGWYCYSHSTGGGIFEWVAVEEGICSCRNLPLSDDQFKRALRAAADRANVSLVPDNVDYEELSEERRARHALDTAVDVMHDNLDTLLDGMTIRRKLKDERGFSDETIDEARIGYINDQAHAELLEELSSEELQMVGLHRDNGSLHVRERIIYPYLNGGVPSYWIGRMTEESPIDAKYIKPHSDTCVLPQPVYTAYPPEEEHTGEVWVAEGIQDAISLAEEGGVIATSPVATNPSPFQKKQLIERCTDADRAVVCFDADDAGEKKAIDLSIDLMRAGAETEMAFVPEGDPNDFFVSGGSFDELESRSAVEEIIERNGHSESVVHRILSTVEPNTMAADDVVETISNVTPYRKQTLRKLIREKYRYENQKGWVEPVRVEKTAGVDVEWTLVYPDGTEITLDAITGWQAAKNFCEKYATNFNYAPSMDEDEWIDTINGWMEEVGVTEVNPLSKEAQVREEVLEKLQTTDVATSWRDVPKTPHLSAGYSDGTIYVLSDDLREWVDGYGESLRQVRDYLSPIMDGGTTQKTVDYTPYRVWPFDPETFEEYGYPQPEAVEAPEMPGVPEDEEEEEL